MMKMIHQTLTWRNAQMNKESFLWVLQSALLSYDKMSEQELFGLIPDQRLAKIGVKLALQLETLK